MVLCGELEGKVLGELIEVLAGDLWICSSSMSSSIVTLVFLRVAWGVLLLGNK